MCKNLDRKAWHQIVYSTYIWGGNKGHRIREIYIGNNNLWVMFYIFPYILFISLIYIYLFQFPAPNKYIKSTYWINFKRLETNRAHLYMCDIFSLLFSPFLCLYIFFPSRWKNWEHIPERTFTVVLICNPFLPDLINIWKALQGQTEHPCSFKELKDNVEKHVCHSGHQLKK